MDNADIIFNICQQLPIPSLLTFHQVNHLSRNIASAELLQRPIDKDFMTSVGMDVTNERYGCFWWNMISTPLDNKYVPLIINESFRVYKGYDYIRCVSYDGNYRVILEEFKKYRRLCAVPKEKR